MSSHAAMEAGSSKDLAKRGGRACVNCRKGKNRCEGWEEPPCKRCRLNGSECVFEKPEKSSALDDVSLERITSLESQVTSMQGSMTDVSSKLDQLLAAVRAPPPQPNDPPPPPASRQSSLPSQPTDPPPASFPSQDDPDDPPLELSPRLRPRGMGRSSVAGPGPSAGNHFWSLAPPSAPSNLPTHPSPASDASAKTRTSNDSVAFSRGPNALPVSSPTASQTGMMWDVAPPRPELDPVISPVDTSARASGSGRPTSVFGSHSSGVEHAPPTWPLELDTTEHQRPSKRARFSMSSESTVSGRISASPAIIDQRSSLPPPTGPGSRPSPVTGGARRSSDGSISRRTSVATPTAPFEALAEAAAVVVAAENAAARTQPPAGTDPVAMGARTRPSHMTERPHAVQKGILTETEARDLVNYYFAHCDDHLPVLDPAHDTYASLARRYPFLLNAICAVALRAQQSHKAAKVMQEAMRMAKEYAFGNSAKLEGVQAMLLLVAWSGTGWAPCGIAVRTALELGLHKALGRLERTSETGDATSAESRYNVECARTWVGLCIHDFGLALSKGLPFLIAESERPTDISALLSHPLARPTDTFLAAAIGDLQIKIRIMDRASRGLVLEDRDFVRTMRNHIDDWRAAYDQDGSRFFDEDHFQRANLILRWCHLNVFLLCPAVLGPGEGGVSPACRDIAIEAREAARGALHVALEPSFRGRLRSARHTQLAHFAWSAILSLKMTAILPEGVDMAGLVASASDMAQLLYGCPDSQQFSVTIRIALERFRSKTLHGAGAPVRAGGPAEVGSANTSPPSTTPSTTPSDVHAHDHEAERRQRSEVASPRKASVIGYDLQTLLQSVQAMPTEITTSNPMPEWILGEGLPGDVSDQYANIEAQFLPSWSLGWGGERPPVPSANSNESLRSGFSRILGPLDEE